MAVKEQLDDAISAAAGQRIDAAMPHIAHEIEGMERALMVRVFKAIDDNTLTPQQAHWAWLELLGYKRLAKKLQVRAAIGLQAMGNLAKTAKDGGK